MIQNWETNALPILFNGACFLLAVVVEGYKRSQLRLANWPVDLAGYQPSLTALSCGHIYEIN